MDPRSSDEKTQTGDDRQRHGGVRTLEELLKIAPELYDITVFGAEPHPNYNRILLSPVLAGEQTIEEIVLNDWSWYQDNGITLHAGWKVSSVDRVRRIVHAENAAGQTLSTQYDRLLMSTGSTLSSCRSRARTSRVCWPTGTLPTRKP